MKYALWTAFALGLTACASDPASSVEGGLSLASGNETVEVADRRARNARLTRQMYADVQSFNEQLARQADSDRLDRRGLRGELPLNQRVLPLRTVEQPEVPR